ncbi:MAG: NAD(P)-dependent oxidoreductase [Candidatus Korobacteraceae bacterium]
MKLLTAGQTKLGFIGVGAMGSRLVRRLRDHGYDVGVYDRNQEAAEALRQYGASVASSPAMVAQSADVILSCLTNDDAVRSAYLEADGVLSVARQGQVVIEMSTVSPKTSREVHAAGANRGVNVLDVAISGSTPAVEQGTITLLAGGDPEVFQAAEPIFRAIASQYFLMGPSGAGTSMKLVVNAILGISMQAIAEGIALGEAEGLGRQRLLNVLAQTAVIPPAHKGKLSKAEQNDYSPQFGVGLMNKDFRLILDTAKASDLRLPATTAAYEVNSAAMEADPASDISSVIRQMEKSLSVVSKVA